MDTHRRAGRARERASRHRCGAVPRVARSGDARPKRRNQTNRDPSTLPEDRNPRLLASWTKSTNFCRAYERGLPPTSQRELPGVRGTRPSQCGSAAVDIRQRTDVRPTGGAHSAIGEPGPNASGYIETRRRPAIHEFTEALIENGISAYLRRIQSCLVAQFGSTGIVLMTAYARMVITARRGVLEHRPVAMLSSARAGHSRSTPLSRHIRAVFQRRPSPPRRAPTCDAPRYMATGIISIEIASGGLNFDPASRHIPRALRVYRHADRLLAATLI